MSKCAPLPGHAGPATDILLIAQIVSCPEYARILLTTSHESDRDPADDSSKHEPLIAGVTSSAKKITGSAKRERLGLFDRFARQQYVLARGYLATGFALNILGKRFGHRVPDGTATDHDAVERGPTTITSRWKQSATGLCWWSIDNVGPSVPAIPKPATMDDGEQLTSLSPEFLHEHR